MLFHWVLMVYRVVNIFLGLSIVTTTTSTTMVYKNELALAITF